MAIPTSPLNKAIALASDGIKRTLHPDGSLPAEPPSAPPTFTTSVTETTITASIVAANGADSYRVRVDSGTSVSGLTVSGLTSGQQYSFQVQGVNNYGSSAWSTAALVSTASTGNTPFFTDDFASGDLSKTGNGFAWTSPTNTSVEIGAGRLSGNALRFPMGPDVLCEDSSAEQRFQLTSSPGTGKQEVWFEYYWYLPANYIHRSQAACSSDNTSHQKFFAAWADNYASDSDSSVIMELWRTNDTTSYYRTICRGGTCEVAEYFPRYPDRTTIVASQRGQWLLTRIHIKVHPTDSVIEAWVDGTLQYRRTGTGLWTGVRDFIRNGYLMGYSNGGYTDVTVFYIDEFKVWDTDPGWGG